MEHKRGGGSKHAFLFLAFHHSKVLVEVEAEGEVSLMDIYLIIINFLV